MSARFFYALSLSLLGVGTLAGCAGGAPPLAADPYAAPLYRLVASNQLRITVFGEEALSKNYTVTSAGDISFPLLGDIPAAGKTPQEFTAFLTEQLSNGYLTDPRINVEVLNYPPVYILGEVSRAGDFKYRPELTALQAIALAGGFTYRADKSRIFIRRAGSDNEFTYELDQGRAVYVLPGDTIRVGERYF